MLPLPRLVIETSVLLATYFAALLFAGGPQSHYLDLVRSLMGSSTAGKKAFAST
jgi:hypothetical protein